MRYLTILLCCLFFSFAFESQAQKDKKENKDPKTEKKDPKAKDNTKKGSEVDIDFDKLTREEKNTMTRCPMHNRHMDLSDNYRANASDFQTSAEYPFAYQLQYRRYCSKCTKLLTAEHKRFQKESRRNADKPTFERCEPHNEGLFVNGEYQPNSYSETVNPAIPHAQQYHFKLYCKTCTKLHKQLEKAEDKKD